MLKISLMHVVYGYMKNQCYYRWWKSRIYHILLILVSSSIKIQLKNKIECFSSYILLNLLFWEYIVCMNRLSVAKTLLQDQLIDQWYEQRKNLRTTSTMDWPLIKDLQLNLFLGIRPSFWECTNWRTFSAFRRAVYCTMYKPNEDRNPMRTGNNTNTNEKYEEQNPCESHNSITKSRRRGQDQGLHDTKKDKRRGLRGHEVLPVQQWHNTSSFFDRCNPSHLHLLECLPVKKKPGFLPGVLPSWVFCFFFSMRMQKILSFPFSNSSSQFPDTKAQAVWM